MAERIANWRSGRSYIPMRTCDILAISGLRERVNICSLSSVDQFLDILTAVIYFHRKSFALRSSNVCPNRMKDARRCHDIIEEWSVSSGDGGSFEYKLKKRTTRIDSSQEKWPPFCGYRVGKSVHPTLRVFTPRWLSNSPQTSNWAKSQKRLKGFTSTGSMRMTVIIETLRLALCGARLVLHCWLIHRAALSALSSSHSTRHPRKDQNSVMDVCIGHWALTNFNYNGSAKTSI